ncbi:MAG TPA: CHAT domain-containing protein, partial [Planctomycetota bacterium]|nr:CHAT domain-containing protein [Planctomycetota bacterium]
RDALERLLAQSPAGLEPAALERRRVELAENAAHLGELLLTPELDARVAGWSALTLVADDLVGASAIGLIPLSDARGEVAPLCLSRPVAFLPSLAVGAALAERATVPAVERAYLRDLCLVADVQPSAEARERFPYLTPLPIDTERLANWRAPFLDARVEDLTGARATLAALAAAPPARVQHFVTHGVRDVARVRSAGLALTPGEGDAGLLFGADVEGLPAPALAVLSACSAGRGPERVGDAGASDLSGAFLAAGADAVLLAAVDLPFEPVARFVPLLHAELARGATPAEALWRARVELARDPALADPFHHLAGLRVLGLGHRPLFRAEPEPAARNDEPEPESEPRRFTFGVLIAAAFILPGWLLLRRRRRD